MTSALKAHVGALHLSYHALTISKRLSSHGLVWIFIHRACQSVIPSSSNRRLTVTGFVSSLQSWSFTVYVFCTYRQQSAGFGASGSHFGRPNGLSEVVLERLVQWVRWDIHRRSLCQLWIFIVELTVYYCNCYVNLRQFLVQSTIVVIWRHI